jgi:TPR repeat protein
VADQSTRSGSASSQEPPTKPVLPKELSVQSPQKVLPNPRLEKSSANSNSNNNKNKNNKNNKNPAASNTLRTNPASGFVRVALENDTRIENPAPAPARRAPQTTRGDQAPVRERIPSPIPSISDNTPRAPQEHTSPNTNDFVETTMRARLGEKDAQLVLANMYRDGKGVVDRDYQAAMDWYHKAAEQGSAEAQHNVGRIYYYGQQVPQDYSKAIGWFGKAAGQEYAESQRCIGVMWQYGQGLPQNYGKAMEWFRKAAEQGNAAAQQNIGWLYRHGLDVPKNYAKAMQWYRKAADQGNADAQCSIGYLYSLGLGVRQDGAQAVDWYRKAADQGHSMSQYNLGNAYYHGRGIPEDRVQAMGWYKKAADQGHQAAKDKLDSLGQQGNIPQLESLDQGLLERLYRFIF